MFGQRAYVHIGEELHHWICCVGKCNTHPKSSPHTYLSVKFAEDAGWRSTNSCKYVLPPKTEGVVCPECVKSVTHEHL